MPLGFITPRPSVPTAYRAALDATGYGDDLSAIPESLGLSWVAFDQGNCFQDDAAATPVASYPCPLGSFKTRGRSAVLFKQSTGANKPTYHRGTMIGPAGVDAVIAESASALSARSLTLAFVLEQPGLRQRYITGANNYDDGVLYSSTGNPFNVQWRGASSRFILANGSGYLQVVDTPTPSSRSLLLFSSSASNVTAAVNNLELTLPVITAGAGSGQALLGYLTGGNNIPAQMTLRAFAFGDYALNATQRALMWQWAQGLGCVSHADAHCVRAIVGDSLGFGFYSATGRSDLNRLPSPAGTVVYNFSEPGYKASFINADKARVLATYKAGAAWEVIIHVGINDLAAGVSGAAIYAYLLAFVADIRATFAGARVVIPTVVKSGTLTGGQETQRQALNTLIVANTAGADKTPDPASNTNMQDTSKTAWFSGDTLHWPDGGHADVARTIAPDVYQ
jgi:hypothetical protein